MDCNEKGRGDVALRCIRQELFHFLVFLHLHCIFDIDLSHLFPVFFFFVIA